MEYAARKHRLRSMEHGRACYAGAISVRRECVYPSPRSGTRITPKFEELNRRAAIEDHRHGNAFRRGVRGSENFLSFECDLKVVYFKRDVRDGLDQGVYWAIGLEAHPLNATRTRLKRGDVHLELFQIIFTRPGNVRGDADVVIAPAMDRSGRRLVVPLPWRIRVIGHGF